MFIKSSGASLLAIIALTQTPQPAAAQTITHVDGKLVYSPFGVKDDLGVDSFGETLVDDEDRAIAARWMEEVEIYAAVASAESSKRSSKILWNGVKYLGVGIESLDVEATTTGAGIAAGVLTGVGGQAIEDYADNVIAGLDQQVAAKVIVGLNDRLGSIIRPDGRLDRAALQAVSQSDLLQVIQSEQFLGEVSDGRDIVANILQNVSIAQIDQLLADNVNLTYAAAEINMKVSALAGAVEDLQNLQKETLQTAQANLTALQSLQTTTASNTAVLNQLALNQLPPEQVLSLVEARAMILDPDTASALRSAANARRIAAGFNDAASVFGSTATLLGALNVDPKVVNATKNFSNLLGAGGAFAAAVTMGNPLAIFNTGSALAGAFSAFGGDGGNESAAMSAAILEEVHSLRVETAMYHQEEMSALKAIYDRIDGIERLLNQRFAGVTYDLALLQLDTRELLADGVSQCASLRREFALPENLALLANGLDGFRTFFQADGRPFKYTQCMDALVSRQRVSDEIDFSPLLRADATELGAATQEISSRQDAAQNFKWRILDPTIRYLQVHASERPAVEAARLLYQPSYDLCGAMRFVANDTPPIDCDLAIERPQFVQVISQTQMNPGGGVVLSPTTATRMAQYARSVAPWNGILIEDPGQAVSRVLTEDELLGLSKEAASGRTRHLEVLNSSIRSLDLVIGQSEAVAATPSLEAAAEVLDLHVIPAFAQAQLNGNPRTLNALLVHDAPVAGSNGPDCGSGDLAWDTLCLMETNPIAARNIIRMVVARRLKRNAGTWAEWREALRSPFPTLASSLLGSDILILDAAANFQGRAFGMWGLRLPRVYSDPNILAGEPANPNCWRTSSAPNLRKQDGGVDEQNDFYSQESSSRCYVFDSADAQNLTAVDYGVNMNLVTTERELIASQLRQLCLANPHYPSTYCAAWRQ